MPDTLIELGSDLYKFWKLWAGYYSQKGGGGGGGGYYGQGGGRQRTQSASEANRVCQFINCVSSLRPVEVEVEATTPKEMEVEEVATMPKEAVEAPKLEVSQCH